jgi:hypothetical protein
MTTKRKPFDLFVDFNDGRFVEYDDGVEKQLERQRAQGIPPWKEYRASVSLHGVGPDFKPRVISCTVIREEAQCEMNR